MMMTMIKNSVLQITWTTRYTAYEHTDLLLLQEVTCSFTQKHTTWKCGSWMWITAARRAQFLWDFWRQIAQTIN